jgi:hypothetical protein
MFRPDNRFRGDLRHIAATLNNQLKSLPVAAALAAMGFRFFLAEG